MPEDCYHGQDIIDHAKAFAALHGDKYVGRKRRRSAAGLWWIYALPLNVEGLERDLAEIPYPLRLLVPGIRPPRKRRGRRGGGAC